MSFSDLDQKEVAKVKLNNTTKQHILDYLIDTSEDAAKGISS